ncbi:hypothetical protein FRACYDRAFT_242299 [Fragilariopsis cylindrus CCMP1102]|uniref:Uncharacterized protein n=1 Tax=Fragilariopsis cylindrus CCMP1102 TaxID=635003 RepID=A0A1E7F712_9STRA|nr:hypothetical protein FRACYDRAFT_242299 [Fragilariopsis cylindrus CCMP1102]|eukprot:OEU13946.1 hypothetical protein FRACYDRAFT_242299 [Fragilariopsis cylindrus CCMP1102]
MAYLSVMLCLASVLVTLLLSNQAVHSSCLFADRQFQTQVGQYSSVGIFVNSLNGRLHNGAIIFDEGDRINKNLTEKRKQLRSIWISGQIDVDKFHKQSMIVETGFGIK